MSRCLLVVLALLALSAPALARADAIYRYQGEPFEIVAGRYTTSDSLSGTIAFQTVLAANLTNAPIILGGWSFSDQLKVLDNTNSVADAPSVSTDAQGRIVAWSFDFYNLAGEALGTFNHGPDDQIDQATDFGAGNSLASNMNAPGTWMLVPEPGSSTLALLGLLAGAPRLVRKWFETGKVRSPSPA